LHGRQLRYGSRRPLHRRLCNRRRGAPHGRRLLLRSGLRQIGDDARKGRRLDRGLCSGRSRGGLCGSCGSLRDDHTVLTRGGSMESTELRGGSLIDGASASDSSDDDAQQRAKTEHFVFLFRRLIRGLTQDAQAGTRPPGDLGHRMRVRGIRGIDSPTDRLRRDDDLLLVQTSLHSLQFNAERGILPTGMRDHPVRPFLVRVPCC